MSFPTILTVSRIAIIPLMVFMALFSEPAWLRMLTAGLFAMAAITDALDGYLARKWSQTSNFGAFLDPVADKLLVVTTLVVLIHKHADLVMTLPALIIIGREITVSALREWMSEINQSSKLRPNWLGKWKTFLQMTAIFLLLLAHPNAFSGINSVLLFAGFLVLYLAAAQTLISMFQYLSVAWPALKVGFLDRHPSKADAAEPVQTENVAEADQSRAN